MTNSYTIMRRYNADKILEIIEFLQTAKIEDLMQKKYVLLYNLNSLEDFDDLTNEETMELKAMFEDANAKILALLDQRIDFLKNSNRLQSEMSKDIGERAVVDAVLIKFEDLMQYIEIHKGHLKTPFFVTMINSFLQGLSKLYVWYNNNLNKLK